LYRFVAPRRSSGQIPPVERPVFDGFDDVRRLDLRLPCQIGDGSRDFEDAVEGTDGEAEAAEGVVEKLLAGAIDAAGVAGGGGGGAEAGELAVAGLLDALGDLGGGFAGGGAQLAQGEGGELDVEVDAVEERAGDAGAVALDGGGRTGTLVTGISQMPARTLLRSLVATVHLRGRISQKGYPEEPRSLGEHLRKARLDRHLAQRPVAEAIGCSKATLLNWEKGRAEPEVRFLPSILAMIGYDPRPAATTFAEEIRREREGRGLSQEAFARLIGVDPSTVASWEHGRHRPIRSLQIAGVGAVSLPPQNGDAPSPPSPRTIE
jgi:transcriptional regulator with XRE-family HTH domain